MTERKARTNKVMVLGVDGLDPRYTKHMLDQGKMPAMAEYIKRGACREDLVLLGGHPTITPPMWTTLATGCYANVHGITGFYRQHPDDLAGITYALDSRDCHAEQLWNCTAEAGLKTLVWHWPGSSWPPTSNSENLYVVDGTSPGALGMATSQTEKDFMFAAAALVKEPKYISNADPNFHALCIVEELPERSKGENAWELGDAAGKIDKMSICQDFSGVGTQKPEKIDLVQSYIREPQGWELEIPEGAKETAILLSRGLIRRPALLLKNKDGKYDSLAVYKNKKSADPIVTLKLGDAPTSNIIDDGYNKQDEKVTVVRNMKLIEMAEDGSTMKMWVSAANDVNIYDTWHPKRIYDYVKETCGPTPPTANLFDQLEEVHQCMLDGWVISCDWQSKAIHAVVEKENINVVFSHMHIDDMVDHTFISYLSDFVRVNVQKFGATKLTQDDYKRWQDDLYVATDNYLGSFLHYLDEGWTIIITSDHAQVASKYGKPLGFGDVTGWNCQYFEKWGYTTLKRDENGERIPEVDWTKTKAIVNRSEDIYINLKGRNKHVEPDGTVIDGIVDPADQYELEEEIMTKLYEIKHPVSGHRMISLAVRNKDAVHFGLGGPECGDIIYFLAEECNQHHGDSLSTAQGECNTSVSPIFVGAGPGFKQGYYTDRIIRQVDVAPTMAALLGCRMPAQCEGSPVYQILDWEF